MSRPAARDGLVAVVAALPAELGPLIGRLRQPRRCRLGAARIWRGSLGGRELLLAATGDGAHCARAGLEALLGRWAVSNAVLMGVAGGLAPQLRAGQLVMARQVVTAKGSAPAPDPAWTDSLSTAVRGVLMTSERIAVSVEEKAALWRSLGRPPAATVDLETAVWAEVLGGNGIPYVAVRAVSDTAAETLPIDFNRFRGSDGRVRPWAVAWRAILRPTLIPELRRLEARLRSCASYLADVAAEALQAG